MTQYLFTYLSQGTVTYPADISCGYLQYIEIIIHYTEDRKGETTVSRLALNQRKLSVWFFATKMEWAKKVTGFTVYGNSSISTSWRNSNIIHLKISRLPNTVSYRAREACLTSVAHLIFLARSLLGTRPMLLSLHGSRAVYTNLRLPGNEKTLSTFMLLYLL